MYALKQQQQGIAYNSYNVSARELILNMSYGITALSVINPTENPGELTTYTKL